MHCCFYHTVDIRFAPRLTYSFCQTLLRIVPSLSSQFVGICVCHARKQQCERSTTCGSRDIVLVTWSVLSSTFTTVTGFDEVHTLFGVLSVCDFCLAVVAYLSTPVMYNLAYLWLASHIQLVASKEKHLKTCRMNI